MKCPIANASATLGLVALAAIASPCTAADDSAWYVGGNVGKSKASIDDERITSSLLSEGFSTMSLSDEKNGTGFKLFGGYKFNRFFAMEGGYFNLGKFGFTANTLPLGTLTGKLKVNGVNLDLVAMMPFTERFSAFARAGVIYAEAKDTFTGSGAVTVVNPNPSKRAASYKFGAGLGFDFTRAFGMRVEAERHRIDDAVGNKGDIDLYSVGLVYRFGMAEPEPAYVPPRIAVAPALEPAPVVAASPPPSPAAPPPPRRVSFSADALFAFDKSVIRPEGARDLEKFARDLRGTSYQHIHVYGYTDRIGSEAYNLALSQKRADAVKGYLVDTAGLDAGKVKAEGRGKSDPVTKPGECEGKRSPKVISCLQPDRRVELEVDGTQR